MVDYYTLLYTYNGSNVHWLELEDNDCPMKTEICCTSSKSSAKTNNPNIQGNDRSQLIVTLQVIYPIDNIVYKVAIDGPLYGKYLKHKRAGFVRDTINAGKIISHLCAEKDRAPTNAATSPFEVARSFLAHKWLISILLFIVS